MRTSSAQARVHALFSPVPAHMEHTPPLMLAALRWHNHGRLDKSLAVLPRKIWPALLCSAAAEGNTDLLQSLLVSSLLLLCLSPFRNTMT